MFVKASDTTPLRQKIEKEASAMVHHNKFHKKCEIIRAGPSGEHNKSSFGILLSLTSVKCGSRSIDRQNAPLHPQSVDLHSETTI